MTKVITPKNPSQDWLGSYFLPGLLEAKAYAIDTPEVSIKLDQNESPWDWPMPLKEKILSTVAKKEWNRYPESMGEELHRLLGEYVNVPADCLLTSPGSNVLIPLVLDAMGRNTKGKVVIARPSFALLKCTVTMRGSATNPGI